MDKNLLVQVVVGTGEGNRVRCGTAYPIAPGRLITAAHVIEDATPEKIDVSWYHQPAEDRGWKPCISIAWDGRPKFDVMLLQVDCPEALKNRFGVLTQTPPKTHSRWESEGFPLIGKRSDNWLPIPMKGAVYSIGNQSALFQLDVDDPPTRQGGWRGASGSPVFVDGAILGVIVTCPEDFANGRLEAVPVSRLLADTRFRAAAQLSEDEQRKALVDEAVCLLAESVEAFEELAPRVGLSGLANGPGPSRNAIEALLDLRSPPPILKVLVHAMDALDRDDKKSAADVLESVAYYLIPAALTDAHVSQMNIIIDATSGSFEFRAKTKTFVEIAMARINGRQTKFRPVADAQDTPSGRLCLTNPPESGMDASNECFIHDFVAELAGMIGRDLVDSDPAKTVEAINVELETQFEDDGWQYYYVFEFPQNEQGRHRRQQVATRLDDMFPLVAFIGLHSGASQEEQRTVTRLMRILRRAAGIERTPYEST